MKKKKWNRFLSVVVTAAMLVAPLQGFSFVDDLFTTAGVTTKASAQDIAQTDTSQTIGVYPYFANEPADCDASAKLGSEQNPLEIANAVQLYNLYYVGKNAVTNENNVADSDSGSSYMDCYFKVTGNIDLSELKEFGITEWSGIGAGTYNGFCGKFDGGSEQGYIISNMAIDTETSLVDTGLFSKIGTGGEIKNVSLKNPKITGKLSVWSEGCGFLAGKVTSYGTDETALIENCHILDGSLQVSSDLFKPDTTDCFYNVQGSTVRDYEVVSGAFGGIVGEAGGNVTIRNCTNESGNINCEGLKDIGGIVGVMFDGGEITSCTNNALVSGTINVGGIAGLTDGVTIRGCKNTSAVSGLEWSEEIWDKIETAHKEGTTWFSGTSAYDAYAPAVCIGGIAGKSTDGIIASENEGDVTGIEICGGIAGGTIGNVSYCMNYGDVSYSGNADHSYKNMSATAAASDVIPLKSNGVSFGGIVGSFGFFEYQSGIEALQVSYSGNAGKVTALGNTAGIVGNRNYDISGDQEYDSSVEAVTPVTDCYNAAEITSDSGILEGKTQLIGADQTVERSYYLADDAEDTAEGRTKAQYKSGQVAWELSHQQGENISWTQKIGKQDYPDAVRSENNSLTDTVCRIRFIPYLQESDEEYSKDPVYANLHSILEMPKQSTETEIYTYYSGVQKEDGTWEAGAPVTSVTIEEDCVILVKKEKNAVTDNPTAEPVQTSEPAPVKTAEPVPPHPTAAVATLRPTVTTTPTTAPAQTPDVSNVNNTTDNTQNNLQNTNTTLTKGATIKQNNMNFTVNDQNSVTFKGMNTKKANVTIPDTIISQGKKLKVTTIAEGAFEKNTSIKNVTLGKNVKQIGRKAFRNCKKLKKVNYPSNLQQLGAQSFENCTGLQQVSLPDSVKTIGKKAFKNCKKLKKFTIGKKKKAAKKAGGMLVPSDALTTTSVEKMADVQETLEAAKAGNLIITEEEVSSYAALNMKIAIGNNALENCSNLKSVIVNCAVSVIGNSAFKNCTKLSAIIVRSLILKSVGKKALTGVSKCKISVPTKKFKPYRKLFKNKGQGKKVFVAAT